LAPLKPLSRLHTNPSGPWAVSGSPSERLCCHQRGPVGKPGSKQFQIEYRHTERQRGADVLVFFGLNTSQGRCTMAASTRLRSALCQRVDKSISRSYLMSKIAIPSISILGSVIGLSAALLGTTAPASACQCCYYQDPLLPVCDPEWPCGHSCPPGLLAETPEDKPLNDLLGKMNALLSEAGFKNVRIRELTIGKEQTNVSMGAIKCVVSVQTRNAYQITCQ
jgi:hypothetical protein